MGKKRKELSHAEVWDDSALLQSWDDALAEYKLYHSIHARGDRVEDVIKDLEATDEGSLVDAAPYDVNDLDTRPNGHLTEELEDGELDEADPAAEAVDKGDPTVDGQSSTVNKLQSDTQNVAPEQEQDASRVPNAIINDVQDDALKNLMMSWYYAGYYTGLYEGQQRAHKSTG